MVNPKSLNPFEAPQKGSDWSREEVEKRVEEISKGFKVFVQAYNWRMKLIEKRIEALKDSGIIGNKTGDTTLEIKFETFERLEYCNRNERRLMKLLEASKRVNLDFFKNNLLLKKEVSKKTIKMIQKACEATGRMNLERLIDVAKIYQQFLEKFYSKLELIKVRLDLEEEFIKKRNLQALGRYVRLLIDEIEEQKKMEKKLIKKQWIIKSGIGIIELAGGMLAGQGGALAYEQLKQDLNQSGGEISPFTIALAVSSLIGVGMCIAGVVLIYKVVYNNEILKSILKELKRTPSLK